MLTIVVAAACAPVVGRANVVVETLGFRLGPVEAAADLHFLPFDPSLGMLETVQIQVDAVRRHSWALWAAGGGPRSLSYEALLTGTTLTVGGDDFGFADLHLGPASTPVLSPVSLATFVSEYDSGRSQFLGGLDPEFPSAFQPATGVSALGGTFSLPAFDGSLSVDLDPGVWSIRSAGFYSASLVDVAGVATVTYNYRPREVPDSGAGSVIMLVWTGLMVLAARMRVGRSAG